MVSNRTWVCALLVGATLSFAKLGRAQVYSNVVINTRNYSGGAGGSIPDNNSAGITTSINVPDSETVISINSLTINNLVHAWAGDLTATVTHNSTSVQLFNHPNGAGESSDFNGNYRFINGGANLPDTLFNLGATGIAPSGDYAPLGNFSAMAGLNPNGNWSLNIADNGPGDAGSFGSWDLSVLTGSYAAIPDAPSSGSPTTLTSSLTITDNFLISSINSVTLRGLNHTAVGDLIVSLVHVPTNTVVDLFSQVGKTTTDPFDIGDDSNLSGDYVFALGGADFANAAAAGNSAYNIPTSTTYAASTSAIPGQGRITTMASFNGLNINGEWQVRVTDTATGDVGSLQGFTMNVTALSAVPEPGSLALVALGSLMFGAVARRKYVVKG